MIFVITGSIMVGIFLLVLVIRRRDHTLARKVEATEKKMDATEQALKNFTAAISDYAQHLSSHTSAIQGLAEASHELKRSAALQNNVVLDLLKHTEDALVRKEALLTTLKVNTASTGKPAWEKTSPSYRALHKPAPLKPTPGPDKTTPETKITAFEAANLVEAMVLPYYRALYKLERENPASGDETTKAAAKKAVEAIMLPFYRTLYQAEPGNSLPEAEKPAPPAKKLDEEKSPHLRHETAKPGSPFYSRRRHPLKPW